MICVEAPWRDLRNLGGISYFGLEPISGVDGLLTNGPEEPFETLKQTLMNSILHPL